MPRPTAAAPRLLLALAATLLGFLLLPSPAWADWLWPLRGEVITPYRNGGDPYASGQHRGIDIAGDVGAPVVAAAGGQVRFAGSVGSSGLTVSVRTEDGRYDTSYLHLGSIAVRAGQVVQAGDRLGTVGTTGSRSSERPHLHFGVRDAGARHAYHDPLGFLPPPPPAGEPPTAAPSPQPAPAPLAPAPTPQPVRAPAERRIPVRAPARRRVPVRRPVPIRAPGRAPARRPVGRPVGRPVARPVRTPSPAAPRAHSQAIGPNGRRHPLAGAPSPAPAPAERSRLHPASSAGAQPAPANAEGASASPRHQAPTHGHAPPRPATTAEPPGPDLGLLLACLGLVAAAATLGLTGEGRRTTTRTARRLSRMVEPLCGRR